MQNTRNLHVLVVGRDPALKAEFEEAAAGIKSAALILHHVAEVRPAIELARDRAVDVVCVDGGADGRALQPFQDELRNASAEPLLIGLYRPGQATGDGAGDGQPWFVDALRAGARDFLRRPVSALELEQVLERHVLARAAGPARSGRVLSFISNKGGVGKSTTAVSVACQLARRYPDQVLLVDASLQLGVCASLLDLAPETTLVDAARESGRLDGTLLRRLALRHSCGLSLLAAPRNPIEAAAVDEQQIARILTVARRAFEFVVVDTFPLLDGVAVAILDLSDLAFVLVSSQLPHVTGVKGLLDVLQRVGCPESRQRIVLNETHPRYAGKLAPADVAGHLGRDVDHVLPFDKALLVAANTGVPHALHAGRWNAFGRAIAELVRAVTAAPAHAAAEAS